MRVRSSVPKFAFFALGIVLSLAVFSQGQQPRKESLLNGLKVLMFPDARADKVWVRVRINSGSAFDPQGKEGVMQLLAANIFPNEAAKEYFSDDLGGSLDVKANYDYIEVDTSAKPENLVAMLETLAAAISNPTIDKDTTNKLRDAMIAKVTALESEPGYVADRAASKRLFGTFPYGRPVYGTRESLGKIGFADLLDARQRFLTADNATVIVSGNFQASRALQAVKRFFGSWLKADKRIPATFRLPDDPPAGILTVDSPVADKFAIRFAVRGTSRSAADMAAADVYARIVGARLKARVPAEVSSSVFVRNESNLLPGSIVFGFEGTRNVVGPENGKVELNDLLPRVLADPITEAEFTAARSAAAADWSKRATEDFWLDADTYGTNPSTDRAIFNDLTAAKVRDFAAWAARQASATVLVNTPK